MPIPIIGDIVQALAKPIDDLVGDKDLARRLKAELASQLYKLDMAQIAVKRSPDQNGSSVCQRARHLSLISDGGSQGHPEP